MHGELGAAYAAKGYAHYTSNLGVCMVSTGCGSVNTLTGVLAAYQDNVPMLVVAGEIYSHQYYTWARQSGTQSANMKALAGSIVKHFYRVTNPQTVPEEMRRCLSIAKGGRPGPVWIEVPLNLQSSVMV
jgi:acetolactate synthase-1/2/3 large subunit